MTERGWRPVSAMLRATPKQSTTKPSTPSQPVTPAWAANPPADPSSHWFTKTRINPKPPDVSGKPIVLIIGGAVVIVYVARLASRPGDVLRAPGQMVKIALGGSFVTVVLLLLAEVHGEIAEQFAWLVLLFVIVRYGSPAFGSVSNLFKQPYTLVSSSPKASTPQNNDPKQGGVVPKAGGGGGGGSW